MIRKKNHRGEKRRTKINEIVEILKMSNTCVRIKKSFIMLIRREEIVQMWKYKEEAKLVVIIEISKLNTDN